MEQVIIQKIGDGRIILEGKTYCNEESNRVLTLKKRDELEQLKKAWGEYLEYLEAKYPPKEGEEFKLSCPHHQKITKILNH